MKSTLLAFVFCAFYTLNISGQFVQVQGTVGSAIEHAPLPFVVVVVNGDKTVTTNEFGQFQFQTSTSQKIDLKFTMIGFSDMDTTLIVQTAPSVIDLGHIWMSANGQLMDEVIVIANDLPFQNKYLGSNSSISKKEMEKSRPIGSEEMLKKVPGVNVSGDMGISNRLNIGIRGSYPRRSGNILLLEDGTPIAPAPYLAPEAYYNPPSERLDGIEILKGADVLTYGNNTMYGVVNYITKMPPVIPALQLSLIGGKRGYRSAMASYGGTWNQSGAEFQFLHKEFDGFQKNNRMVIDNFTTKWFSHLNNKLSIYGKVNYHREKALASYSSLTPLTFRLAPNENPFDADELDTRRLAFDLNLHYKINDRIQTQWKVYYSAFQRYWWRQETTLKLAQDVLGYVGQQTFDEKYSYLNNVAFTSNDWVRVGKVTNGRESTRARNRDFEVMGAETKWSILWDDDKRHKTDISARVHQESFINIEMLNDSSRFARQGKLDKHIEYNLNSLSGYIKHTWLWNGLTVSPVLRVEQISLSSLDVLSVSKDPNSDGSDDFGVIKNDFFSAIPGCNFAYDFKWSEKHPIRAFAGIYQGYTAPIADVAFMHVTDDNLVVGNPATADLPINRKSESSVNGEAGLRGEFAMGKVQYQVVGFNNMIRNFYSAGRSEAFQSLGSVRIYGSEVSVQMNIGEMVGMKNHQLSWNANATCMRGEILGGTLSDGDMLKLKHTDASKLELIEKINDERSGYDVYFNSTQSTDSIVTRALTVEDFGSIKKLNIRFGENGVKNLVIPYLPEVIFNTGFSYNYKQLGLNVSLNYTGAQYTEYLNLKEETAEGAAGRLPAFYTVDAGIQYEWKKNSGIKQRSCVFFISGKNLTNEVYQASRLHRLSSGIMPAGWMQINAGVHIRI